MGQGSSASVGARHRSVVAGSGRFRLAPDFTKVVSVAAADFGGANTGKVVFIAPAACIFLGIQHTHTVAGTNSYRVKKIKAGNTSAPGAAADTNNIDISGAVDVTVAANTVTSAAAINTAGVNQLAAGDRVAVASAAGSASLANGIAILRFAWL